MHGYDSPKMSVSELFRRRYTNTLAINDLVFSRELLTLQGSPCHNNKAHAKGR